MKSLSTLFFVVALAIRSVDASSNRASQLAARRMSRLAILVIAGTLGVSAQVPQVPTGPPTPGMVPPSAPAVPADTPASVQGRIVAAETGKPLHRARIRLNAIMNVQSRVNRETLTDRDGRYRFDNLPSGSYSIRASYPGYVELQAGQKQPDDRVGFWRVAPGQLERIDFTLPHGGVITGRITDDAGDPMAGVGLTPLRLEYMLTGAQWRPYYAMPFGSHTDDRGEFRIAGLPPGTYLVVGALQSEAVGEGYAATYYPGTTIQSEAQRLKIVLNEEVTASFSLVSTTQVLVTGQVHSSTGEPLKRYNAVLTTKIGVNSVGAHIDDRTGEFEFKGVQPGTYVLEIRSAMNGITGTTTPSEFAVLPMAVGNEDIDGLLITTGNGVTLSGHVIYEGTAAKERATSQRPRVYTTVIEGAQGFFRQPNPQTNGIVAEDGRFSVTGVYGTVILRSEIPGWQLKSVTLDGVDITDVPYDTARGGTNRLEVVVTDLKQGITGRVVDTHGNPPSPFSVFVFPRDVKPGTVADRYTSGASRYSSDGTFQLMGLPPGDYFAAALRSVPQNASYNLELHEALKPRATPFQLSPGETTTIELTLIE